MILHLLVGEVIKIGWLHLCIIGRSVYIIELGSIALDKGYLIGFQHDRWSDINWLTDVSDDVRREDKFR